VQTGLSAVPEYTEIPSFVSGITPVIRRKVKKKVILVYLKSDVSSFEKLSDINDMNLRLLTTSWTSLSYEHTYCDKLNMAVTVTELAKEKQRYVIDAFWSEGM
jgi:hypothetical protein